MERQIKSESGHESGASGLSADAARTSTACDEKHMASNEHRSADVTPIDYQQRRGALLDIIDEAIAAYDDYMTDDDYDAQRVLDSIITTMRRRKALYEQSPSSASAGIQACRL